MKKVISLVCTLFLSIFLFCSCTKCEKPACCSEQQVEQEKAIIAKAMAVIQSTEGHNTQGFVVFEKAGKGVQVVVKLSGLTPGKHGFHVHQWGDISAADGTATGGHYNPTMNDHAGPDSAMRHVGDLGNITADIDGKVDTAFIDTKISLNGKNSIVGRGIIVHADEDDLTSQPTGAAGARVGQGTIGVIQ